MFIFINIFLPPADLPWFALAVANLLPVHAQSAYATVRVGGANLLCIQVTGLCWRWSDLNRRLGRARPRSATARSAVTPVVTRPQCLNMLSEGCVKPWRGRGSCIDQMRDEIRETRRCQTSMRAFMQRGFDLSVTSGSGHLPRYPHRISPKPWILEWVPFLWSAPDWNVCDP